MTGLKVNEGLRRKHLPLRAEIFFCTFSYMRRVSLIILSVLIAAAASAQQIRIYGRAESGGRPLAGVMVMVFEQHHFYKKFKTDARGQFRFAMGASDYTILFYRPGMNPESYHIVNNMATDQQFIPINMEMSATTLSTDSMLQSPLLTQAHPDVIRAYLAAVYAYGHSRRDTAAISTRRSLLRHAIEERERFSSYHQTSDSTQTSISIGPDVYDMLTDARGAHRYYKNKKPITEITYDFETNRRYEGVLKNKRDVRRFEKYNAMEHVKDRR